MNQELIVNPYDIYPARPVVPRWYSFVVLETAFTGVGLTEDVQLLSLPGGWVIHAVRTKHSASFTGGGALSATLSVGINGNLTKYAGVFDVFQAPSSTAYLLASTVGSEDAVAATSIRASLIVTVGTTGGLTAGAATIDVLLSTAR